MAGYACFAMDHDGVFWIGPSVLLTHTHFHVSQTRARMEAFEAQMSDPAVQSQMAQMQAVMQNPTIMQRMAELRVRAEVTPNAYNADHIASICGLTHLC